MLRSLKDLEGYTVQAVDGDVGTVVNFLVDDQDWVSRYLVVLAGSYFESREVLITPLAFRAVDWSTHLFHLNLTREQILNAPGVDTDKPVSRQHELAQHQYYGYPNYWGSSGIWDAAPAPAPRPPQFGQTERLGDQDTSFDDVHLRSTKLVRGYHIHGTDAAIGHVDDFIVDDETWAIRYLVVDTQNWWFGKKVLVPPQWATGVSWEESAINLNLTRQQIKDCPEWDPTTAVNRLYEERLYDYYGRPVYWKDEITLPISIP